MRRHGLVRADGVAGADGCVLPGRAERLRGRRAHGVHSQESGDPIAYDPPADRLVLVPGHGSRSAVLASAVRACVEQAVGPIAGWTDVS